jgi:hypothetical protein
MQYVGMQYLVARTSILLNLIKFLQWVVMRDDYDRIDLTG